jgi:hypothetical protein
VPPGLAALLWRSCLGRGAAALVGGSGAHHVKGLLGAGGGRCELDVLVGVVERGADEGGHGAVDDDEVLVAVGLDACGWGRAKGRVAVGSALQRTVCSRQGGAARRGSPSPPTKCTARGRCAAPHR